jgi:type IV pilus assembly protein PilW
MYFMAREIRMAGYNPGNLANIGINQALVNQIQISYFDDQPGSATSGSTKAVTYRIADSDGDADNDLMRDDTTGIGTQQLAQNIDALNFVYLDANGSVIANPNANLASIRSIQITLVARTGRPDPGYNDTTSYANQSGTTIFGPANDAFRRRVLTREVRCRNIGL